VSWATSPAWAFDYQDTYGDLTKITLPTGGTISYAWGNLPLCTGSTALTQVSRAVGARTVDAQDGTGPHTWSYAINPSLTTTTDPNQNETLHYITEFGTCGYYETQTKWFQGSHTTGTLLKTQTTDYIHTANPYVHLDPRPDVNVLPIRVTTIWPNGKTTKVETDYDASFHNGSNNFSYGDVLAVREYDYGSGAPGPLRRTTTNTYLPFTNSSCLTANLLDLISTSTITDGSGTQIAKSTYSYDGYTLQSSGITTQRDTTIPNPGTRGNLTSVCRWLNTTGGNLCTTTHYYDTGMPYQVTDPRVNTSTYSFSSTNAGAYLTQTSMPDTNSPNLAHHIVSATYDFNTGQTNTFTDQNSQQTTYGYDPLGRITSASFPDGGLTSFTYTDTPLSAHVERTQKIDATRSTDLFVYFDGLARTSRSFSANGESTPYDQEDTCYGARGNVSFSSYPYQGNGTSSPKVCSGAGDSFANDPLNRITLVTHSDSSTVASSFAGGATSVLDEGNGTRRVQRISQVDGLGRLISVCEVSAITLSVGLTPTPAPCGQDIGATGFLTTYTYDALNNLKTVAQGGLNSRSFVYDSLSRLTSAANPESGSTIYNYDSDTNCTTPNSFSTLLLSKVDARGVRTCMRYDNLNRLTQKNYSDSTPVVTYNFDESTANGVALTNTIGRASSQSTTSPNPTAEVFSYDQLGRVKTNSQCTPQNCGTAVFPVIYTYDLLGNMVTSTNGGGVTLSYTVNLAARLTKLTSSLSDANHPGTLLQNVHYGSFGPTSDSLGNGMTDAVAYHSRGWLQSLSATSGGTTRYSFSLTLAPNGDITTGNDSVNGNWTYAYDDFKRLLSANATGQAYTYDYDRFGNRWHQNGPHPSSLGFDANNRITSGSGVTYDAAGNVTADGSHTYAFDAENRLTKVDNGSTAQYVYNAMGQRVRKTAGSSSVDYLYDLEGHAITELSSTGGWNRGEVYATGKHLATYNGSTTYFIHADWLGTERARTDISGNSYEACTSLPFGDWLTCTGGDPSPMHFTGKERDSESGLDNFEARYNSSSLGRFMSPDPENVGASLGAPQSWNAYSYVLNNPLNSVDPTGLDCIYVDINTGMQTDFNRGDCDNSTEEKANSGYYVDGAVDRSSIQTEGNWIAYTYTPDGPSLNNVGAQCWGDCPNGAVQVSASVWNTPKIDPDIIKYGDKYNTWVIKHLGPPAMVISGFTGLDPAFCGGPLLDNSELSDADHAPEQTEKEKELNEGKQVKRSTDDHGNPIKKRPGPAPKGNQSGPDQAGSAAAAAEAMALVNNGINCIANSRK